MQYSKSMVSAIVASTALAGIGAASAADLAPRLYTKAPAMVVDPVYNWTGFYVGASAGYNWSRGDVGSDATVAFTDPAIATFSIPIAAAQLAAIPAALSTRANGFIGGVQAGYNRQWDRTVLGIEADFSGLSARG